MTPLRSRGLGALVYAAFVVTLLIAASANADEPTPDPGLLEKARAIPATVGVRVHIVAPPPVQLQRRPPGSASWVAAPFRLAAHPGGALTSTAHTNEVKPPSAGGRIVGVALLVPGIALAALGSAGVILGIKVAGASCTVDTSHARSASQYDEAASGCDHFYGGPGAGGVIIALSAVLVLGGGGLIVGGASLLARSPSRAPQKTAFVRQPTWVGPQVATPTKPALVVPLAFAF